VIVGPMLAGFIFEWYKAYDIAYYIGGGSCIIAAIVLLLFYPKIFVQKIFDKV
jgi:hypothetical protein